MGRKRMVGGSKLGLPCPECGAVLLGEMCPECDRRPSNRELGVLISLAAGINPGGEHGRRRVGSMFVEMRPTIH